MKEIIITTDKDGNTTIEALGFSGNQCLKATKPYEDALGGGAKVERKLKPEFHSSEGAKTSGATRIQNNS